MAERLDLLLVYPPSLSLTHIPPLGLGFLLTACRQEGLKAGLLDSVCFGLNEEQTVKEILAGKPRAVGFSVLTKQVYSTKNIIKTLRRSLPETKIILGGPHISAIPEHSLLELNGDAAICGEADETLPEVAKRLLAGKNDFADLKGISWKTPGGVQSTKGRGRLQDLSLVPQPAWDLMPPTVYPPKPGQLFYQRWPVAPMATTRGCDYSCKYCATILVHGVGSRTRPVEQVLAEVDRLYREFGVREIHFQDDNLTGNRDFIIEICNGIADMKLDLIWKTPVGVRIDEVDAEMLDAFRRSGCYQLGFGLESADEEVLKANNKRQGSAHFWKEKLDLVHAYGIEAFGYFVVGLPGDNKQAWRATRRFLSQVPMDYIHVSSFTPWPGSPYFAQEMARSLPPEPDWSRFTYFNNWEATGLSSNEIQYMKSWMQIEFLLHKPLRIWNLFKRLKLRQVPFFLDLTFAYLFGMTTNIAKTLGSFNRDVPPLQVSLIPSPRGRG